LLRVLTSAEHRQSVESSACKILGAHALAAGFGVSVSQVSSVNCRFSTAFASAVPSDLAACSIGPATYNRESPETLTGEVLQVRMHFKKYFPSRFAISRTGTPRTVPSKGGAKCPRS
jgi:hypothetical protein